MKYQLTNVEKVKEGMSNGREWVINKGQFDGQEATFFGQLPEGEVEGELVDGKFGGKEFKPARKEQSRTAAMSHMMDKKTESIRQAQDNKEHAIKIASCNGQAGNIVAALIQSGQLKGREDIEKALKYWKTYIYTRWDDVDSNEVTPFD